MSAIYQNGVWYAPIGVHTGFTPVGTIISVMGVTAPMNYLACDGQIVNITDYPELATYFETQFGSKNKFGGNGTTTFGIPDLRGEFLRGTGTNSHSGQGSGAAVGTHQNGTEHTWISGVSNIAVGDHNLKNDAVYNADFQSSKIKGRTVTGSVTTGTYPPYFTSRPTNTSVLYCIATKNIFMDAGNNYSTEEQVVGTWVNGKPIYQKTITNIHITKTGWSEFSHGIANVDLLISVPQLIVTTNSGWQHTWGGNASNGFDLKGDKYEIYTTITQGTAIVTFQYTKTTD